MKVTLICHTPDPEKVIACAAKLCYADTTVGELYDGLDQQKSADFVTKLANLGHESPIEHVTFTFGIEGVSRALLAQITRHRIASFSVQSQRYVKKDKLLFVTPPEIAKDAKACEIFKEAMDYDLKKYNELADMLQEKHTKTFLEQGFSQKKAESMAEKKAIEDARFVLPNACDTQMIVTMNARSLLNFFRHRCCNRAQWEIKAVADEMLKIVCEIAPTLFKNAGPSCYAKVCSEGAMSCQKAVEMKEFYKKLHEEAQKVFEENKGMDL